LQVYYGVKGNIQLKDFLMKQLLKTHFFVILAVGFLIVGSLVYLSQARRTQSGWERDFRLQAGESVDLISLDDLSIERTRQGWILNQQFSANESAVNELISTLRHLFVRFPVPGDQREQVMQQMHQHGISVKVFSRRYLIPLGNQGGLFPRYKLVKSLIVGKDIDQSTYMKIEGSGQPFVVQIPGLSAGLREIFIPRESLWRDPVLIDLQAHQIKQLSLTWHELPQESFSLQLQNPSPVFKDAEGNILDVSNLDNQRFINFLNSFTVLYYEQLVTQENESKHNELMFSEPFLELQVLDHRDQVKSYNFYRSKPRRDNSVFPSVFDYDPDRLYIRFGENQYATGQYFVFNRIMRQKSFFFISESPAG
jgi:hypothetical protein